MTLDKTGRWLILHKLDGILVHILIRNGGRKYIIVYYRFYAKKNKENVVEYFHDSENNNMFS